LPQLIAEKIGRHLHPIIDKFGEMDSCGNSSVADRKSPMVFAAVKSSSTAMPVITLLRLNPGVLH